MELCRWRDRSEEKLFCYVREASGKARRARNVEALFRLVVFVYSTPIHPPIFHTVGYTIFSLSAIGCEVEDHAPGTAFSPLLGRRFQRQGSALSSIAGCGAPRAPAFLRRVYDN